jgi:cytoskeletal protein RodZ
VDFAEARASLERCRLERKPFVASDPLNPLRAEKRTQTTEHQAGSIDMRSSLFVKVSAAILLVSASVTNAQDMQPRGQPSARATLQDDANASAQSDTDMSYGGIVATRSEAGAPQRPTQCNYARQCNLFSKH